MNDEVQKAKADILDAGKRLMVEVLRRDAILHEQGRFTELGEDFQEIDGLWPRESHQLGIAWNFYDSWIDERNHNFVAHYEGIAKGDWPKYARYIADQLEAGTEITDALILSHFDYGPQKGCCLGGLIGLFRRQKG